MHRLDLVLSDRPVPTGLNVKAYSHSLGESGVSLFANKRLVAKYAKNFPASLQDAPLLMPVNTSALRRGLDDWFDRLEITPRIVAEFDDSALLKAFGEAGMGIFPAPEAIASEVEHMYHARSIGSITNLKEQYFAISPERKIKHPAVLKITEAARKGLFG